VEGQKNPFPYGRAAGRRGAKTGFRVFEVSISYKIIKSEEVQDEKTFSSIWYSSSSLCINILRISGIFNFTGWGTNLRILFFGIGSIDGGVSQYIIEYVESKPPIRSVF
jgi:hypothetical protein